MRRAACSLAVVVLLGSCAPVPPVPRTPEPSQPDAAPQTSDASTDTSQAGLPSSANVGLGVPLDADPSDDILIDHQYFVLSYNPRLRDPNWVSWHLVAADLGSTRRQNNFHGDALLPPIYPPVLSVDYQGSGYSRGHMCPSGDRTGTAAENDETFVMTNMQPQLQALNAGPWEQLEAFERQLVTADHKEVYVVAGGLFDPAPATIGPGIAVPRANYKIVIAVDPGRGASDVTDTTVVYAVIMPNAPTVTGTQWRQYLTTVDAIERESGYDFLTAIPAPVQAAIEGRQAPP
jgi:endonuclease G